MLSHRLLLPLGLALALCLPAAAEASARIAILDFKGPKATKVRAQLMKSLCKAEKCVKPGKGGDDVEVDAAVTGSVKKVKGKLQLVVEIYSSEEDPPVTKKFALKSSGKLDAKAIKGALKVVRATLSELEADSGGDELASAE